VDIEARVRAALGGVAHEIIDCDPALADTAEFCTHYGYPPEQSANTIVVASRRPEGHHAACVVLATTRLDVNRRVRDLLGVRKVSFASPELTARLTGMTMGGVTPFGLPAELPLWIDAAVVALPWVIVGGGSRSCKVRVAPEALTALPNAVVVEDLAKPFTRGEPSAE
jgi:prolyl-tRNA editing enzyme YbaK/EbsC (Cys-tRNA(Pro) deacylase)